MKTRVAYITGTNGQLGVAITNELKKDNWFICGIDIGKDSSNPNVDLYTSGSVSDRSDMESFFQSSKSILSTLNINGFSLINNAGVAVFSPSEERTAEEFDFVVKTNLLGPTYGSSLFHEHVNDIKADVSKTIVNIASIYGLISPNESIYTDTARNSSEIYGASKAGVIQLTKYFACKYAKHGITVNCVAPGGVLNEKLQGPMFIENYSSLVPMRRLCQSEDVGKLVKFLAEGSVKYLTGQTIALDGGMSAW